jgi:DNA-binding NtrC family response regulator
MVGSTIMVVSADQALIDAVRGAVKSLKDVDLEVVPDFDEACARVERSGLILVLAHLSHDCSVGKVTRLLGTIEATAQKLPTLVLSDNYYAEQALAMLRLGAADYLTRPLDLVRLTYTVDVLTMGARRGLSRRAPKAADDLPVSLQNGEGPFSYRSGNKMGQMMDQVRRIAPQDTTILLGGETGTGKTRLAGLIHQASPRRDRPFLTINCGALSATLIESEMFGHAKGAFTGADCNRVGKFADVGRGTLFLDEIDSLPPVLQAKLLRAVEDRVFEPVGSNKTQPLQARLIVASNRPLEKEVEAGRFRADLFYRLNVVAFTLPPLRERMQEVPNLAQGFLADFARRIDRPILEIAPEAMRALEAHSWPGNVRELRNVIERAVALCEGPMIRCEDLPAGFSDPGAGLPTATCAAAATTLAQSKDQFELERITEALLRHGNNRLRAAAELGISRMTLYKKLHKFGLMAAPSLDGVTVTA